MTKRYAAYVAVDTPDSFDAKRINQIVAEAFADRDGVSLVAQRCEQMVSDDQEESKT